MATVRFTIEAEYDEAAGDDETNPDSYLSLALAAQNIGEVTDEEFL